MVLKLFAYILLGAGLFIPLGIASWAVVKPRIGPLLERRRLRKIAAQRMRLLDDGPRTCIVCERAINPQEDAFDARTKAWLHPPCYRRLIGTEPEERKPS